MGIPSPSPLLFLMIPWLWNLHFPSFAWVNFGLSVFDFQTKRMMVPGRELPAILEQRAEMLIAFTGDMPISVLMPMNFLCPGSWSNIYSLCAGLKST